MIKKLSLFLTAAAVAALGAASTAAASTGLTTGKSPGGTLLPVGSLSRAKNISNFTFTSSKLGTTACTSAILSMKVTKNNESEGFEAIGSGQSSISSCRTPSGASFLVSEFILSNLRSPAATPGHGTATFSFTVKLGEQVCKLQATNGQFTYTSNTANIALEKVPLATSGTNCGTVTLDTQFRLETTAEASIFIM